jgi:hypothetical protein
VAVPPHPSSGCVDWVGLTGSKKGPVTTLEVSCANPCKFTRCCTPQRHCHTRKLNMDSWEKETVPDCQTGTNTVTAASQEGDWRPTEEDRGWCSEAES